MLFCIIILTATYYLSHRSYEAEIEITLSKKIEYISFQPHVDRELVKVENKNDILKIQKWLLEAKKPGIASYPPTTCKLIIHYDDSKTESIFISPTGITKSNFLEERPSTYQSLNYAMISYKGFFMGSSNQPFTEILKKNGKLLSNQQDSNRITINKLKP